MFSLAEGLLKDIGVLLDLAGPNHGSNLLSCFKMPNFMKPLSEEKETIWVSDASDGAVLVDTAKIALLIIINLLYSLLFVLRIVFLFFASPIWTGLFIYFILLPFPFSDLLLVTFYQFSQYSHSPMIYSEFKKN